MSEVTKPVEATPPTTVPETTTLPVLVKDEAITANGSNVAPVEGAGSSAVQDDKIEPVTTAPATTEVTPTPLTDGVLGYKAPGLVKSLRFSKKYFWFGDAAVPTKDLHSYLRGEKPEVAHDNVAWSSQTGKGLLYFAKSLDQKAAPAGIINLAEVSELTKDGGLEFHFKLNGHKHTFQAVSAAERDAWFARLETAVADAKTMAFEVTSSAGYQEQLEQLGKSNAAVVAGSSTKRESSAPRKSTDKVRNAVKRDDSSSDSSHGEGKKALRQKSKDRTKSRSLSRKRASLFGSLMGKKEEHDEKKAEVKDAKASEPVTTTDAAATTTDKPAIPLENKPADSTHHAEVVGRSRVDAHHGATSADAEGTAARVLSAPVENVDESKPAPIAKDGEAVIEEPAKTTETPVTDTTPAVPAKDATPKPTKRNSFFGAFFQRRDVASPADEKKEKDVVPAVPPKDSTVASTAPVLPEPNMSGAPTEPTTTAEALTTPAVATTTEPAVTPTKEKPTTPRESFFGKFMKGKTLEPKDEKLDTDKKAETPAVPATTTQVPTETAATEPESTDKPLEGTMTTTVTGEPSKDKRRTSFFNTLGARKEKRADAPTVETEPTTDSDGKTRSATGSPLDKFGGLFRKPSRSAKSFLDGGKKESAPAVPAVPTTETAPAASTTDKPSTTEGTTTEAVSDAPAPAVPTTQTATPPVQATA
ncbi:MAG: hypothetical protein M1823_005975 [Watsoniomyces obsoletus]|nr:MAG: hypothetical protein M1823_005975 [Watsoniomyces obsoletus]